MKISFTINITRKIVLALVAVTVIGSAAAAMTLFTHTFPVVTTRAPTPILTTSCSTLSNETAPPVIGSSGNITFSCGGAHTVFSTISSGGIVTPTFSLVGTGYTSLFIWQAFNSGVTTPFPICTGSGYSFQITSGTPIDFGGSQTYMYCALYTSAPAGGFGTFTVTWTQ